MLSSIAVTAQIVPNRGFEQWENEFMFETLDTWTTSNQEGMGGGTAGASKSTDSHSGNYSVLQTEVFFGVVSSNPF